MSGEGGQPCFLKVTAVLVYQFPSMYEGGRRDARQKRRRGFEHCVGGVSLVPHVSYRPRHARVEGSVARVTVGLCPCRSYVPRRMRPVVLKCLLGSAYVLATARLESHQMARVATAPRPAGSCAIR